MLNWIRKWLGFDFLDRGNRQYAEMYHDLLKWFREDHAMMEKMYRELSQYLAKREDEHTAERQALTQSLARALSKSEVPVVYPRRGPLEASPGWFDGKPRVVAANDKPLTDVIEIG